jgi:ATP-dependent exoDNAse (exonuclease V) alpha subunit
LSTAEHFAAASLSFDDTDRLPTQLTISLQMKVMVMKDICTHAGLANGTRGTIAQIVLDEREPGYETLNVQGRITLTFPPTMLLLKPTVPVVTGFEGIPKGLIPIFPTQGSFKIKTSSCTMVHRQQFALTPAYTFTNFKSQGQTIERVIVDLGKTSSFMLNPFHAYVALS